MKQFNTTKEDLQNLGSEFESQALPLIEDLYNLAFWLVLKKRIAKKIVRTTYEKAIYYCDKTKAGTDWEIWMHRILFKRIFDYYNEIDEQNDLTDISVESGTLKPNTMAELKEKFSARKNNKGVIELLRVLPHNFVLPLVLLDIYRLPHRLVSEYLDIPDTALAVRIYKARRLFFKLFVLKFLPDIHFNAENSESRLTSKNIINIIYQLDKDLTDTESVNSEKESVFKAESEIQQFTQQILIKSLSSISVPASLERKIKKEAEKRFFTKS
jgi:RNA polymerase sigma-70 factor (ECF subfamily)